MNNISKIKDPLESREWKLITLSAKNEDDLDRVTQNFLDYLHKNPGINMADAAYSLNIGQKAYKYRRIAVCSDIRDTINVLSSINSLSSPNLRRVHTYFAKVPDRKVVFMFSGLGSQYVNMGRELYKKEPVFRKEMERCFEILNTLVDDDIKEILYPAEYTVHPSQEGISYATKAQRHSESTKEKEDIQNSKLIIHNSKISQIIIFIFEYALARLLIKWGIKPQTMIGYSFGEYAAACISGVFSLEDAIKLVVARGQLIQTLPPSAMLSVPLSRDEIAPLLDSNLNPGLSLAIDNGPSCIVAGSIEAVDAFEKQMKEKRYLYMRLPVSRATHSQMMTPILTEFEEICRTVTLNIPKIPYISNVTGTWLTEEEALDPGYWAKHLRQTVQFADGMRVLIKHSHSIFLEIGPGRDISTLMLRHIESSSHDEDHLKRVMNLVRHPHQKISDIYFLLNRIGKLWLYGQHIDWPGFYSEEKRQRISLPTYPFSQLCREREKFEYLRQEKDTNKKKEKSPVLHTNHRLLNPYVAPGNQLEQALSDIWQELFGLDRVGVQDDFFELGGDSLMAITSINKIHKKLNVLVSLGEFFNRPTIEELARYVNNMKKLTYFSIEPVEKKDYYPVSSAQKRFYLLQQMDLESTSYNVQHLLPLGIDIDEKMIEEIFMKLIKRHDSLRTSFEVIEGEPVQKIHENVEFGIEYYDLTNHSFIRPFHLFKSPLLRVARIKCENEQHILVVDMHHIITDGTSMEILANEFEAMVVGEELPALKVQYKDYSRWQYSDQQKSVVYKQEEYWLKEFAGEIPRLNLPTDYVRPEVQSFKGNSMNFLMEREETQKLTALALKENVTLYIMLLSIFNLLLSKISGNEDIVIGTPTAGRMHEDFQQVIGMFVNTLALRNYPGKEKSFKHFLQEVKERTIEAFDNQEYQFDDLVGQILVKRDVSRNPLFDVMFVFQSHIKHVKQPTKIPRVKIPGETGLYEYKNLSSINDITLYVIEDGDRLLFSFKYCIKLFKEETIRRFIKYFKEIVSIVTEKSEIKLGDITISHNLLTSELEVLQSDLEDFAF